LRSKGKESLLLFSLLIKDINENSCYISNDSHLDVPETPTNVNITSITYSTISLKWQAGFDGGWMQTYWISLDDVISKQTNETFYTFRDLKHSNVYNITIRAQNHLGQSRNSVSIRAETKDVPIEKEGLNSKTNEFL
jgi:hypothetical protein